MSLWLGLLALTGCLVDVPRGPDLGACADTPEGTYSFGEAGIGTCLAGPADLVFFQQDGVDWLAVTNADPFRTFRSGSVLLLKWFDPAHPDAGDPQSGLASRLEEASERTLLSDLQAFALEISDDDDKDNKGGNPFLGGFGYLPDRQQAVVSSRLTEALTAQATQYGLLRVGKDELYVLDLSGLSADSLGAEGGPPPIRLEQEIRLEDDPFPVVVDEAQRRIYVGNLTDHSVSVLSSDGQRITEVDVAGGATTTKAPFRDLDGSGSQAAVSTLAVQTPRDVVEDRWTLSFIEGTVAAWVPTPLTETVTGLVRWTSGNARDFQPSPFGFEQGIGDAVDPFVETDGYGNNALYYVEVIEGEEGQQRRIWRVFSTSVAGEWNFEERQLLLDRGFYGAPSVAPLVGEVGLFAERKTGSALEDPSQIVLATSLDATTFSQEEVVLDPGPDLSYEDPFVALDSITDTYRMWLSIRREGRYEIALTESPDGRTWGDPVVVLSDPERSLAAPTVAFLEGRYGMWFARDEGDRWDHVFSWSYDGLHWSEPELVIEAQAGELEAAPYDPLDPPRLAILADRMGGWRLEGADTGPLPSLFTSGTGALPVLGFELAVAGGQELDNSIIPQNRADLALVPGHALTTPDGRKLLFASTVGTQLRRGIALLEATEDGDFELLIDPARMREALGLPAGQFASDPVVVPDGEGYVLFFTLWDNEEGRLRRVSIPAIEDLLAFSDPSVSRPPLAVSKTNVLPDVESEFDSVSERAHSARVLPGGDIELWYTGSDGSVSRIGTARADSPTGDFSRYGFTEEWRLGPGSPGSFDDSGVQDPLVIDIDGETHLYYAGFDGASWHIGHALVFGEGQIVRESDELTGLGRASLSGLARTFSAEGANSPILWTAPGEGGALLGGDRIELLYAGFDGTTRRIGRATVPLAAPDQIFAEQRFPTSGDQLSFSTTRGGPGNQVMELAQEVQDFTTSGIGMSALALDAERGFLYVTTKLEDLVYVLDVRNDSSGSFVDANYLDLEAVVALDLGNVAAGARDLVLSPSRGLGYLSIKAPDGVAVLDLTRIPDDDRKEKIVLAPATILPMQSAGEDAGQDTWASFSGGRAALTSDERLLLVPHFRGNGLSVFDLELAAFGQEIAWLPNLGENPHVVKVSPDGKWAVVANYLGDVENDTVSSTLAVVSLDPESDRYLEVVTWLANR